MFYNRMKKLPFVMLTLLVLAACNNNSSITPSSSSSRPSTSITTSSSNVTSSSSPSSSTSSVSSSSSNVNSSSSPSSSTSSVSSSSSNVNSSSSPSSSTSSVSSSSTSVSSSSNEVPNDERYAIYVKAQAAGFTGTYEEWLDSIKGADGTSLLNGTTNPTSSQGKNGDTYINTSTWDVYVKSGGNWTKVGNVMGPKGDKGDQGEPGQNGTNGNDGLSSYEIYKQYYQGYPGTEQDWINDFVTNQLVKTVTLNFDGGTTSSYKTSYFKGEKLQTLPTTTKQYYTFDNWQINNQSIGVNYYVVDNVTITAKWTILEGAILSSQDLINIKDNLSGSYFMVNNIDLSGVEWIPIGTDTAPFTGTLDGQGFTISNLIITTSQVYVGLFGYNEGTIKNLKLANVDIDVTGGLSSNIYGGAFIGYNNSNSDLENLNTLSGDMLIRKRGSNVGYAGGLIGYQNTNRTISNSSNNINITADLLDRTGGLVGFGTILTFSNSYNSGSVSGLGYVGGLLGIGIVTISNSYNIGSVIGSSDFVGGLVGFGSAAVISNSYNGGSVTGRGYVGGFIGTSGSSIGQIPTISNSYNSGSVTGRGYVGGFIGSSRLSTISNSFNSGSVTGNDYSVGGLVGYGYPTISNSSNSGSISNTSNVTGGLIGSVGSGSYNITIFNSFNSGSVSGGYDVGGLVGTAGSLGNSNYGNVTISNSYNIGSISGSGGVGGLVGTTISPLFVYYSINFGSVIATSNSTAVGGISGNLPTTNDIEQTYYSGSITSNGVAVDGVAFGTKVTDLSTFNLAFFTTTLGWDTDIWDFTGLDIANGVYPTLKNMPVVED
jgi:hypothetical protein